MKIAIYCRVSDDKKKDDGTRRQDIQRQVDILTDFALKRYSEIELRTYTDDGKSAFTEDWNSRPAFKQLMNDCRMHRVKEILIEDMTRFSRRVDLGLPLLRELGELNINLISLKEDELAVTSSHGWLKSTILLMFAEWDSRIKSDKVKHGMQMKKNIGKHIGRPKEKGGA